MTNEQRGGASTLREISVSARAVPRAIGELSGQGVRLVADAVSRGWSAGEAWLLDGKRSVYGLAVTRILFGLTGVGLLLTNFRTRLYTFGSGSAWNGEAAAPVSDFPRIWVFSWFDRVRDDDLLFTVLYLVLLALAVLFTLGWRFKVVLPVYLVLWVSFIEMNDAVGDQGDNMYRIALFLLLFADPARCWSLDARRRRRAGHPTVLPAEIGNLLHNLALVALAAQVFFVYASGGLYKAGGEPWQGGYAVYAPLHTERFGTWPALSDLVTAWGPSVTIASWGSIILQVAFPLMLLRRPTRIVALVGILSFHVAIGVLMGLPFFSLAMIGIDFIFIRDRTWQSFGTAVRRALSRRPAPADPPRDGDAPVGAGQPMRATTSDDAVADPQTSRRVFVSDLT